MWAVYVLVGMNEIRLGISVRIWVGRGRVGVVVPVFIDTWGGGRAKRWRRVVPIPIV